jgi:hypothetical protein
LFPLSWSGVTERVGPRQLLRQRVGERLLRVVEQLGQLANGDEPRRHERGLLGLRHVDENFEQATAGAPTGQGNDDMLEIEQTTGAVSRTQIVGGRW